MRFSYAVALAALIVSPALAQTQYADSAGGFVSLHRLSLISSSTSFTGERAVDVSVGYRYHSGVDVSLRAAQAWGTFATSRIGPTVGFSRPVGAGFEARVEASALASRTTGQTRVFLGDGTVSDDAYPLHRSALSGDVTASVSRPIRLIGSVRLRPTLGVYGRTAIRRESIDGPGAIGYSGVPASTVGLHVELPLSFRLFGQDVSVAPAVRFPFGSRFRFEPPSDGAYAGGGLRLNF